MAFGLSWKSRTGSPTSSTSPTCVSYSEAGLSQRTGSDGATIQRYVWIISIAGCGFALELIWYAGERQLPNKVATVVRQTPAAANDVGVDTAAANFAVLIVPRPITNRQQRTLCVRTRVPCERRLR